MYFSIGDSTVVLIVETVGRSGHINGNVTMVRIQSSTEKSAAEVETEVPLHHIKGCDRFNRVRVAIIADVVFH